MKHPPNELRVLRDINICKCFNLLTSKFKYKTDECFIRLGEQFFLKKTTLQKVVYSNEDFGKRDLEQHQKHYFLIYLEKSPNLLHHDYATESILAKNQHGEGNQKPANEIQ